MTVPDNTAMSWDEWAGHDGTWLAERVRAGDVTAGEAVAQAVAAVAKVDPQLEAVLEIFDDVAADPLAGDVAAAGALFGVPIFLKDLGSRMSGRRQESGSRLLRGHVADVTDPLIRNYMAAGLIPLGRSTTPEFGMTFDTSTGYLDEVKVTRNPWNPERTPGGSSGGSAALVAAGAVPVSMSSDGGGSTRIPASYCGLVGLKASRGRIAMPLNQNEYTWRHAVEGVVTRSVRDAATVLDYLHATPPGGAFYPMAAPAGSFRDAAASPPAPMRVALSTGEWGRNGPCDPQVDARVREVGALLEDLGHTVEEVDDADLCDWETMWRAYLTQWVAGRMLYAPVAGLKGIDPDTLGTVLSPMVYRHFDAAQSISTLELLQAMAGNNVVTRAFGEFLARWDVLLCPTHAIRVPEANGPYSLLRDEPLEPWLDRLADACRYTMPGNESGVPGISVPAGLDTDGLPIGAMLYAGPGREDRVIALAAAIEAARTDWFEASPMVHVASGAMAA